MIENQKNAGASMSEATTRIGRAPKRTSIRPSTGLASEMTQIRADPADDQTLREMSRLTVMSLSRGAVT